MCTGFGAIELTGLFTSGKQTIILGDLKSFFQSCVSRFKNQGSHQIVKHHIQIKGRMIYLCSDQAISIEVKQA